MIIRPPDRRKAEGSVAAPSSSIQSAKNMRSTPRPRPRCYSEERRTWGSHIGAALRHARAAAMLNLDGASADKVLREAGHALDCLGAIVWPHTKER